MIFLEHSVCFPVMFNIIKSLFSLMNDYKIKKILFGKKNITSEEIYNYLICGYQVFLEMEGYYPEKMK